MYFVRYNDIRYSDGRFSRNFVNFGLFCKKIDQISIKPKLEHTIQKVRSDKFLHFFACQIFLHTWKQNWGSIWALLKNWSHTISHRTHMARAHVFTWFIIMCHKKFIILILPKSFIMPLHCKVLMQYTVPEGTLVFCHVEEEEEKNSRALK